MLTDTQLTGLRLALDNAGTLGIKVWPWEEEFVMKACHPPITHSTWVHRIGRQIVTIEQATPEHYDALCARYARKLKDPHCLWVYKHLGKWYREEPARVATNVALDCPDDELTALVHALADAEGKGVVR